MRQDPYKREMFKRWLIPRVIGAIIIFMTILIVIILVSMNETTHIYNEGMAKSIPLISNDKMKKLGDLYIRLNDEFEQEIMNLEINYANRHNKRGDLIHYGVNGKENSDEVVNDDYVNGIESIKYIKGKADNRKDGESNFIDMLSFLSVSLGSDIDRYSSEQLEEVFTKLFHLTHTFTGTSTELYPCEHGCSWCKYYCGDYMVQGEVGGNTVGFYKVDEYMGEEGKYGLMYDPFLITKESPYNELRAMASDTSELFTIFHNRGRYGAFSNGESIEYREVITYGRAVTGDSEIYRLQEPDGFCEVCSYYARPYRGTTRKFAGCNPDLTCYHGRPYVETDEDGNSHLICMQCMYREREGGCTNYEAEHDCDHEHSENCEWEDGEAEAMGIEPNGCKHHTLHCKPDDIGCAGYYECEGHEHYSCPGHIIVTCFGHTNLNLEIKIMYYEEMIDVLKNVVLS